MSQGLPPELALVPLEERAPTPREAPARAEGPQRTANPFAAAGDRSVDQRVTSLKLRTALLCCLMVACAVGGWRLLQGPLAGLVLEILQMLYGGRGLPLPHVPDGDPAGLRGAMQTAVIGGVAALALIGHSYGKLGKLSLRWALVPPVLLALVFRGLPLVPAPMEIDILRGDNLAAARHLEAAQSGKALRAYVMAQVALRSGDSASLRREGEAVLEVVDRTIYGVPGAGLGLQFEPALVLAIDRAVNGEPQTDVGLAAADAGRVGALLGGALHAGRVVLGVVLFGIALALLQVWNVMRRRVASIDEQLAADAALAEAEARRQPLVWHRSEREAVEVPLVRWGTIFRLIALMAAPVLLVKLVAAVGSSLVGASNKAEEGGPRLPAAQQAEAALPGDAAHPCELVGAWTSSRGDSVFKVTLTEDGRFAAEPIAAGPHGNTGYRGRWEMLEGRRLRWVGDTRPSDLSDVNPILDSSATAFTLREVNGQASRFNRIGPVSGQRCH